MKLKNDNYYSNEADKEYMSVSQFKNFAGSYGLVGCEEKAMKKLRGEWVDKTTDALLVGSYVDSYFEGTLDDFKERNPQIFLKNGNLSAKFKKAEEIITRIERDEYFMKFMNGEKQVIVTGEICGAKWKGKLDVLIKDTAIVDLKVMADVKSKWVRDLGYLDFIRYWGYDIQAAVYQELVRQQTGKKLPFYFAVATKEEETDLYIIQATQNMIDEAMRTVERYMPRILDVKNGKVEPERCEQCNCCKHSKVLTKPITVEELMYL